jgi:hypothetical protein
LGAQSVVLAQGTKGIVLVDELELLTVLDDRALDAPLAVVADDVVPLFAVVPPDVNVPLDDELELALPALKDEDELELPPLTPTLDELDEELPHVDVELPPPIPVVADDKLPPPALFAREPLPPPRPPPPLSLSELVVPRVFELVPLLVFEILPMLLFEPLPLLVLELLPPLLVKLLPVRPPAPSGDPLHAVDCAMAAAPKTTAREYPICWSLIDNLLL